MNLAEIRKKAQQAESPEPQQPGSRESSPARPQPPQAAGPSEPLQAPATPESAEAPRSPEPAGASRLAEPPAPVAPCQPPPPFWEPEAAGAAFPADLEFYEEPEAFDPVAVILKGRESASFEEVASQEEQADAPSVELLCFRVASEEYAISILDIKEIIKPREVTEVPRMPPFVRGILSLRGNIIPIFDMRVRLGLSAGGAAERERVIVVKRQTGFCGVLVDEVVQVVRIAESGVEPPPVVLEGIDRDFVQGIGRVGGRMLILLDMEKVLDVELL
jgi:purine-binding chemotaxis protein CheW